MFQYSNIKYKAFC